MHAFIFVLISILFSFAVKAATPSATTATRSIEMVPVDTVKDCVVVSSATGDAQIDFYESECKAFGGYKLNIKGSDLRYSPVLSYVGHEIDMQRPFQFHDMADTSIEWLYEREVDEIGVGKVQWRGLIYSLEVSEEQSSSVQFYGIRLNKKKSCVVAIAASKELAQKAILDPNSACK